VDNLSLRSRLLFGIGQAVSGLSFRSLGRSINPPSGWIPLAQVEDPDNSPYPAEEQLWPSRMRTMVANFSPMYFRPPVIRPDGGPSHHTGEHSDPCGFVTALDFDGVTLWGRLTEISDWGDGRIECCVADGYWGRSIGFWIAYGGQKDNFKLRHLALLGGEPEGQADQGLPPLTRYFKSAYSVTPEGGPYMQEATRAAAEPYATRVYERHSAPLQEAVMNQADLDKLLEGVAKRAGDAASDAVGRSLAPLEATIAKQAETLTRMETEIQAARSSADEAKATAATAAADHKAQADRVKEGSFRSALAAHVTAFRVAPGEVDGKVKVLMALPDDLAAAELASIAARPPAIGDAARSVLQVTEGDSTIDLPLPAGIHPRTAETFYRADKSLAKGVTPEQALNTFARTMGTDENGFLN